MKKLLMVILAVAMIASFLPKAEAGETANLGLSVSFDIDEPLEIWAEDLNGNVIQPNFEIEEKETLEFKVVAEDLDTLNVYLEVDQLPRGATFLVESPGPISAQRRHGLFQWTPEFGQAQTNPYQVLFRANNSEGEIAVLTAEITVLPGQQVIAIEISPATWSLDGVGLGETRTNDDATGSPVHRIINQGNVDVTVDIGYGPSIAGDPIQPGTQQGENTFVTWVSNSVLDPSTRIALDHPIQPNGEEGLPLTYGAPASLSFGAGQGHSVTYELRAYGPIIIEQ